MDTSTSAKKAAKRAKAKRATTPPHVIGWREWVALPDFGVGAIKAKVDTGARTSALHATHVKEFERDNEAWVRFRVHPVQRKRSPVATVEAKLLEHRAVKSSSGASEVRPVILATVVVLGQTHTIELTLTSRDAMGFRMLLGREAVRRRFLVDPGRSYLGGKNG